MITLKTFDIQRIQLTQARSVHYPSPGKLLRSAADKMRFSSHHHPWSIKTWNDDFNSHGPNRQQDTSAMQVKSRKRFILQSLQPRFQALWTSIITRLTSPTRDNSSKACCSFFEKLPIELRLKIYNQVMAGYPETIHILAGQENNRPLCPLFHIPCITPTDFEIPTHGLFPPSRWTVGAWGSYHFYCDLYSSQPSILHMNTLLFRNDWIDAPRELRTPYEVVSAAECKFRGPAPFLPLLLTCRRMHDESINIIYSSLNMSFIGQLPLSIFTRNVKPNLVQSLHSIHLVWPSWWKMFIYRPVYYVNRRGGGNRGGGTIIRHQEYWRPPEPDSWLAKLEWDDFWEAFSHMEIIINRLHITLFQVRSEVDRSDVVSVDELLPALCKVRAKEFFVEAWGTKARVEEPSAERPFRLSYNPMLGV